MKNFFLKVLAPLCVAAIVANVAVLWKMEQRLTRIETLLQFKQQLAQH